MSSVVPSAARSSRCGLMKKTLRLRPMHFPMSKGNPTSAQREWETLFESQLVQDLWVRRCLLERELCFGIERTSKVRPRACRPPQFQREQAHEESSPIRRVASLMLPEVFRGRSSRACVDESLVSVRS